MKLWIERRCPKSTLAQLSAGFSGIGLNSAYSPLKPLIYHNVISLGE